MPKINKLKKLENAKNVPSFCFLCSEGLIFSIIIYVLLLANLLVQTYQGQQNTKYITLQSLKITVK